MTKQPYAITICLLGLTALIAMSASAAAQSTAAGSQPSWTGKKKSPWR